MDLGRIRRGRIAPGNGVDVEAIAGIAGALRRRIQVQLERRNLRAFADLPGRELIRRGRQPHFDAGPGPVVGVHAGQPDGRGARMIAGAVAERVGLQVGQAGSTLN